MVEILRNKWCEDLDDILQCPICFFCPNQNVKIYQCIEGHIICEGCKIKILQCPTCNKSWSPLRNRVVEDICAKLDDIKMSLIDPEAEINKLLLPDKICAATQTNAVTDDKEICTVGNGKVNNGTAEVVSTKNAFEGHSGLYPCCIGNCQTKLAFQGLSDHICSMHFRHFVELPLLDTDIFFQHVWTIELQELQFDRAFRIPRVGTFFVQLSYKEFGDLTGFISMINSASVARQFSYQLKFGCCSDHKHSIYTGDVNSCRTPITDLEKKCLQVEHADLLTMMHTGVFKCTMNLTKKLYADAHQAVPKKKRNRNRNNTPKTPAVKNWRNIF